MFTKLTDSELYSLINFIHSARESIYDYRWPIGTMAIYTAMAMDMSILLSELNGEQSSRQWKAGKSCGI
jgi:hypothetical protein